MKTNPLAAAGRLLTCTAYFILHRASLCLAGLGAWLLVAAPVHAAPPLCYAFTPGRQYVYEVKITATLPDATETREGLSIYNVKSAADQQFTLRHSGSLSTRRKTTAGQPYLGRPDVLRHFPWSDNVAAQPGDMAISASGKIISTGVNTSLPYMLGDLEALVIEEFPADGKSKWEQQQSMVITQRRQSRFPRGPFAPAEPDGVKRSATETAKFSIAQSRGDTVRLKKEYALRSEEKVEGNPRLEMSGEGELVFDTKQGAFQSVSMKYTYRHNEPGVAVKIPLVVECCLLSEQETTARLKAVEDARTAAQAAVAKANEPRALEPGERETLLKDLKSTDEWAVRKAADRLAKAPADDQAEAVAQALNPLLGDRNGWIRAAAAKAIVNWGTSNSVPALVAVIGDRDLWVRKSAMEALGRHHGVEGAKAVASRLVEMSDRAEAAKALKAMGGAAESAVLPFLKDRDMWVRVEACKILGEVGTASSLAALEELGHAQHGLEKTESEKAVKAIKARQAGSSSAPPQAAR